MGRRCCSVVVCLAVCLSGSWAVGQAAGGGPSGLAISGPSPWIDPTSPVCGALCNGKNDDTSAIQLALNAIPSNTGGALFIPPTTNGCVIVGFQSTVTGASIRNAADCAGGYCPVTVTFSAVPAGFVQNGLVNIHNVSNGTSHGTIFNGTYQITAAGKALSGSSCVQNGSSGTACISYLVPGSATDSGSVTSNSIAEIGLYFNGNNLKMIGAAGGSNSGGSGGVGPSGSMLVTNPICAGCNSSISNITILTTMTNAVPHTGPDIQNINFYDGRGDAFGGLNIANTNGFNVSNDGFFNFTAAGTNSGPVAADPQGGAGIVTTGGQASSSMQSNPWVQFGKIENNHINAKIGFTSKFKISSVTFDSNTVQCGPQSSSPSVFAGSIGLDIGGLWYLNYGTTNLGGENRVINQQNQYCLVGTLLGSQNNDRVETKSENSGISGGVACNVNGNFGGSNALCTLGMALVNTDDSTLFNQSKSVVTGLYLDPNSPYNVVYENRTGGALSSGGSNTLQWFCPSAACTGSTSSVSAGSLVVASAVQAGTSIFGTPSSGSFAPTSNSTFTTDNEASGLNVTVAGTNVGLTVTGDASHTSDVADFIPHGGGVHSGVWVNTAGALNVASPLAPAAIALTTEGDLPYQASSALARLAIGSSGQCLTSNGTDPSWATCAPTISSWSNGDNATSVAPSAANAVNVATITIPANVVFSAIALNVGTGDNNDYSWGLYSTSGTAICTTTAVTLTTGVANEGCSQTTPITVSAGTYIFAITGAAAVAKFSCGNSQLIALSSGTSSTTTTGGQLPSTISVPSAGAALSQIGMIDMLFQ